MGASGKTTTIRVELGERGYDIVIGAGLLAEAGWHLKPVMPGRRALIVTDRPVAERYLPELEQSLRRAGIEPEHFVLPPGEHTKSFAQLEALLDDLLGVRPGRDATVIALGGGVIGDLAGFAASILLRGVAVVQVPTTLLAQVDSSVGGKTGIDTRHGKNLVGSFHQPHLVLADTAVLDSLPARELCAGYAEVVKYALIDNPPFFDWLEANGAAVLGAGGANRVAAARERAVAACCWAKARVVAADEREGESRALLNLGHTFAHALEVECGYGEALLHGEAVAIGMVMAFDLSCRLGFCPEADLARLRAHLEAAGLPVAPPRLAGRVWRAGELIAHMKHDKKVRDGRPVLVLARGIGQAFLYHDATDAEILPVLEDALAA